MTIDDQHKCNKKINKSPKTGKCAKFGKDHSSRKMTMKTSDGKCTTVANSGQYCMSK